MSVIQKNIRRCDRHCNLPAKWQIALRVWHIGHAEKPREPDVRALTGMCVCNRHKLETHVTDLLDDDGKAKVATMTSERGMPLPDFALTEIEWIELRSPKQVNPNSWAKFQVINNPERSAHQCHFDGCDSEAVWDAHLIIMGTDLKAETTVRVCDRHQDEAAAFILNEDNRTNLMQMLAHHGITGIDMRNLRVAFGRWEKQH